MEIWIGGGKYYKKWSTNILGISGKFKQSARHQVYAAVDATKLATN